MPNKEKLLRLQYIAILVILILVIAYLLVLLFPIYRNLFSFLWRLFAPFLTAALIAYLLEPIIGRLYAWRIHKGLAILIVYLVFFASVGTLCYQLYPVVIRQLGELKDQLPELSKMYRGLTLRLYESTSFLPDAVHDQLDKMFERAEGMMEQILGKWTQGFTKIFDFIVFITIIPVLVFYFLKDYDLMHKFAKKLIPKRFHRQAGAIATATDESLGNYLRGQSLVCLFVGLASYGVFYFLHMKYALLLAIIMAITNLIPYFGPIIGAIPAVLIAFSISPKLVVYILLAVFVIQLIESNLLSPFIMGRSIRIHPVAILFALLLGGEAAGIPGMVLAVPLLTIIHASLMKLGIYENIDK